MTKPILTRRNFAKPSKNTSVIKHNGKIKHIYSKHHHVTKLDMSIMPGELTQTPLRLNPLESVITTWRRGEAKVQTSWILLEEAPNQLR
jgi:hypothetical protein